MVGLLRLAHPFPSLLNSLASFAIASLAGAPPLVAGRLALSMLGIQASIGALNDAVDAGRDAAEKPGKPIPAGLASRRQARWLAVVAGVVGIALSIPSGLPAAAILAVGLLLGYLYDLRLSRTRWSWLPLALALPVVPIHAWLGATGGLPIEMGALYPATVVAGGALALANGLVDLERDARSGKATIAVNLGADRAWLVHAGLLGILAAVAVMVAPGVPAVPAGPAGGAGGILGHDALATLRTWGVTLGIVALALGTIALASSRPALRERGWELEAIGVGGVGVGWLAGIAAVASGAI